MPPGPLKATVTARALAPAEKPVPVKRLKEILVKLPENRLIPLPPDFAETIAGKIGTRIRGLRAPDSWSVILVLESQADKQSLEASPR
jgi:hypothetical protein